VSSSALPPSEGGVLSARVIDGKAVAAAVREEVSAGVAGFREEHGRVPGLATVLIGDDGASAVYVASKHRACEQVGMRTIEHALPADVRRDDAIELVERLNADRDVSGILVQLPLPGHLDESEVTNRIIPEKDVDGLTVESAGRLAIGLEGLRPCTPLGVMRLLREAGAELDGAEAVILGRSNLFGKPMGRLLLEANATMTICHSHTRDLAAACRRADVLIAAVGSARIIKGDWIKPGAVVIDVGITRTDDGLIGDVEFDAAVEVASAITPVPGGVGPMTIASLLQNTLQAAIWTA
jgi:methylenetetrahydrofolate dehydrogenase (NADP+) / methenyltetrahydrofolate cyclohydrolase